MAVFLRIGIYQRLIENILCAFLEIDFCLRRNYFCGCHFIRYDLDLYRNILRKRNNFPEHKIKQKVCGKKYYVFRLRNG